MNDPYWLLGAIAILLVLDLTSNLLWTRTSRKLLSSLRAEIEALKQDAARLKEQIEAQRQLIATEYKLITFEQLQTLLTQYPSLKKILEVQPDFPAKHIMGLFVPLDNLIQSWKYETIGTPWEQVYFDPKYHQADTADMRVGEKVYIRFVGYCVGDRILAPAKVSRNLPI
ncbi:hypothetical protein Syn7502_01327 [Synechococcus sp. PCC 7502]|uniref:hypothetical protein n=1 Tax=Synechococcus sp. PCC 7502 TaxID=1173263 RepID=UPI00029FBB1C|nr:hypothetical protein [Synechococcus sp. PCC 7502]AFY73420.1 hypothetical protein Syn7502_01327 [Synechococcus sp. PCC 7502]